MVWGEAQETVFFFFFLTASSDPNMQSMPTTATLDAADLSDLEALEVKVGGVWWSDTGEPSLSQARTREKEMGKMSST